MVYDSYMEDEGRESVRETWEAWVGRRDGGGVDLT